MFAALAHQLCVVGIDSNLQSAAAVRNELVQFIHSCSEMKNRISESLEKTDTLSKYLDRMAVDGTWGDGNMLSAAVKRYGRQVVIYSDARDTPPMFIDSQQSDEDREAPITLGYVSVGREQNHYISLVTSTHDSCKMPTQRNEMPGNIYRIINHSIMCCHL